MKGKILDSDYLEEVGVSFVEKATPYGTYYEEVYLHEEDADIANAWDGMRFAEMKCDIKAMKEKAKYMRQRAIGVEIALKNLDNAGVNDSFTLDNLERQVWAFKKEADRYKEIYEEMRDSYQAYTQIILDRRRELRKKADKIHEI